MHIAAKWLAVGAVGLTFALSGPTPARADRFGDLQRAVHRDLDKIRRDENHLQDLNRKRDDQRARRDYRGVRRTEDQIDHARIDLQHDRDLLREDRRELDRVSFRRR